MCVRTSDIVSKNLQLSANLKIEENDQHFVVKLKVVSYPLSTHTVVLCSLHVMPYIIGSLLFFVGIVVFFFISYFKIHVVVAMSCN